MKSEHLWDSHVARLNKLTEQWRIAGGGSRFVPWFDPDDGGVEATVLILLERPALSTVSEGENGFASEDNRSASSSALRRARIDADVARSRCVRWNIVPWSGPSLNKAALVDELDESQGTLHALLLQLHSLRAIVPLGQPALTGLMRYFTLHPAPIVRPVIAAPHPSPANGYRAYERQRRIVNAIKLGDSQ